MKVLAIDEEVMLDMSVVTKNSIIYQNFGGEIARFKIISLSPSSKKRIGGHCLATVAITSGPLAGKNKDISTKFLIGCSLNKTSHRALHAVNVSKLLDATL